jgi:hypothetical protein
MNVENLGYSKKTKSDHKSSNSQIRRMCKQPAIFRYKRCIRNRKAQFAFRREQSNTLKNGTFVKSTFDFQTLTQNFLALPKLLIL